MTLEPKLIVKTLLSATLSKFAAWIVVVLALLPSIVIFFEIVYPLVDASPISSLEVQSKVPVKFIVSPDTATV